MPKRLDHVEAAKDEAIRLGATISVTSCSKHIVGIIAINGQYRKIFLAKIPRDNKICHVVREDIRKKVREMQLA